MIQSPLIIPTRCINSQRRLPASCRISLIFLIKKKMMRKKKISKNKVKVVLAQQFSMKMFLLDVLEALDQMPIPQSSTKRMISRRAKMCFLIENLKSFKRDSIQMTFILEPKNKSRKTWTKSNLTSLWNTSLLNWSQANSSSMRKIWLYLYPSIKSNLYPSTLARSTTYLNQVKVSGHTSESISIPLVLESLELSNSLSWRNQMQFMSRS